MQFDPSLVEPDPIVALYCTLILALQYTFYSCESWAAGHHPHRQQKIWSIQRLHDSDNLVADVGRGSSGDIQGWGRGGQRTRSGSEWEDLSGRGSHKPDHNPNFFFSWVMFGVILAI